MTTGRQVPVCPIASCEFRSRRPFVLGTYADGYDEHFRGNADDRARLKQLSEREREAELLKRHEARESLKHR